MVLDPSMFNLAFFVLILPMSLIFEGMRRKLIARMQNRVGPPLYQPFFDVIKLFRKEKSDSIARESIFFRVIPPIYFMVTYLLFLFIPLQIIYFDYDFILFIYLIVLSGALYIITGFSSNSPFGIIGSMRELILSVCYEMIFAISLVTFFVFNSILSFHEFNHTWMILRLPLASVCLLIVGLVETRITPFDTVEAPTEIMGSAETEYSGVELAFMEMGKYLKLTFFVLLTTMLLFGFQEITLFFLTALGMLFLFTFTQATTSRYRADQTLRVLMLVLILVIFEFIRIKYIVW